VRVDRVQLAPAADGRQYCTVPLEVPPGKARGLRAGVSLLAAGDMGLSRREVDHSHAAFLASLGAGLSRARAVRQVHSRIVVAVDGQPAAALAACEADGMATRREDLLLTVTVADCLPVFLLDGRTGAFAVVHSGWKGTGIVGEAMTLMAERFGTRAQDLSVAMGPGIGACCYEVPAERCDAFRASFGPNAVREPRRLDLRAANLSLLEAAGVGSVSVVEECTCCSPRLGSFRRQGAGGFTRMLAFIGRWPHGEAVC
jgi:YfiH family protein